MTSSSTKDNSSQVSFLHEAQKFGKAKDTVPITDLDQAIADINKILVNDTAQSSEENSTPIQKRLAIYCHDCREIVPPAIKKVRGKHRKVCGKCESVKISAGSEDALKRFYHLTES